jgi:hypothetical protein
LAVAVIACGLGLWYWDAQCIHWNGTWFGDILGMPSESSFRGRDLVIGDDYPDQWDFLWSDQPSTASQGSLII